MERVELIALTGSIMWLLLVVELIRERRLSEGYSLIWISAGVLLLILSLWRYLLDLLAQALGIYYPPSAFIVVVLGLIFLLLLQQSVWICKLHQQNRVLAQKLGLMTLKVDRLRQQSSEEDACAGD